MSFKDNQLLGVADNTLDKPGKAKKFRIRHDDTNGNPFDGSVLDRSDKIFC